MRFLGPFTRLVGRQLRDMTDAMLSALCDVAQRTQMFDLIASVKMAVGSAALRLHGSVAFLPNPDDVRAQSGASRDCFDCLIGFSH